jgi:hypothetical protein
MNDDLLAELDDLGQEEDERQEESDIEELEEVIDDANETLVTLTKSFSSQQLKDVVQVGIFKSENS